MFPHTLQPTEGRLDRTAQRRKPVAVLKRINGLTRFRAQLHLTVNQPDQLLVLQLKRQLGQKGLDGAPVISRDPLFFKQETELSALFT